MRLVYLDESGTSANEEITVVAGVVVHFDNELGKLETELERLRAVHVPEKYRNGFVFHSTDLFHGAKKGKAFARIDTKPEERRPVLKEVAAVPSRLRIPIVLGYVRKDRDLAPEEETWHVLAYVFAAVAVDQFMKDCAAPEEFALLVAENKPEVRSIIKDMHQLLQRHEAIGVFPGLERQLPLSRIREGVYFAEKAESPALQAADAQAFIWRRYFEEKPESPEFLEALLDGRAKPPPDDLRKQKEGFAHIDWSGRPGKRIPFA